MPFLPAPAGGEPYLLTPGPLTTSAEVKQEMLCDWGSWDGDFRAMTARMRAEILGMIGDPAYTVVPMQGSGTFAVEAMMGTLLPRDAHVLVLANGAYGLRAAKTLSVIGRRHQVLDKGDFLPPRASEIAEILGQDPTITHVVAIHCETSSGILNPLQEISDVVSAFGRSLLIDSMSAFGALPVDPAKITFDALVSSANKCIEGVPGFGFVVVRTDVLEAAKGNSHSLSLDLHDQWVNLEKTGQWRYTPPTHTIAAFLKALEAHRAEGGVAGRGARYAANRDTLVAGMRNLGFETLLSDRWLSPIIVTFFCPADPAFSFPRFYDLLKEKGFIIYPGKLTEVDSFRVGCIGQMDSHVMARVVRAAGDALTEMGVVSAAPPDAALEERDRLAA